MLKDRINKELYNKICILADKTNMSVEALISDIFSIHNIELIENSYGTDDFMEMLKYEDEDALSMRSSYVEFLRNYKKLNELFNLQDPMSICELYYLLYTNGYLSYNKEYKVDYNRYYTIDGYYSLFGAPILAGKGCCKHNATLLSDILKSMGITSKLCPAETPSSLHLKIDETKDGSMQSLKEKLNLLEKVIPADKLEEFLKTHENDYFYVENGFNKKFANHAITAAAYEGKSYIFDQSENIYFRTDGNKLKAKNGIIYLPYTEGDSKKDLREIVSLESLSNELLDSRINEAKMIFEGNKDIFDKFYNDNEKLYKNAYRKTKIRSY